MSSDRILVVRVGRAGDMVMITPALGAILEKHPQAEIHLLTSADGRRVLRGFDARITQTYVYDHSVSALLYRKRLRDELAAAGYTHVYCFETNAKYHAFARALSGQHFLLSEVASHGTPFPERCLALVGHAAPRRWLSLPLSDTGRAAAKAMLAAAAIGEADFVVGLHPTSSANGKRGLRAREALRRKAWPLASFARLSLLLAEHAARQGVRLRIICDLLPAERPFGLELVRRSGGLVTLFTEPPDFERYKATIARMNLLITPDTGPMHIAAAVGTPLVALFCGRDPRDCGPYTDPARYIVLRAEETEHPKRGLAGISPDIVAAAATTFFPSPVREQSSHALPRALSK